MNGGVLVEPMQEGTPATPDLVTAIAFAPDGALIVERADEERVTVRAADVSIRDENQD